MTETARILEWRKEERHQTIKVGILSYSDGAVPCKSVIANWSPEGARLRFNKPYDGANKFDLTIYFDELVLVKVPCVIIWQKDNDIGVRFAT